MKNCLILFCLLMMALVAQILTVRLSRKHLDWWKIDKFQTLSLRILSRLGRSYIKVGQLTEITFPSFDVRFIALNDGVDSSKPNETNSIFLPIKSLMDEMYAADTSKKIRAVVQSKARAGERVTVNPPYGYLKDPSNPKNWIIDPVASEVVKRIFQEAEKRKKSFRNFKRVRK